MLRQDQLDELADSGDKVAVKNLSQHRVVNAFRRVSFGHPDVGIINSVPHELLHLLQQGLINYSLGIFLGCLSNNPKAKLDTLSKQFEATTRQSSRKQYPKTTFYSGVTNIANMSADERTGLLFLLTMLVLNNQMWDVIGDRLRQTRDDDNIQVYNVKDVVCCD